MRPALRRKPSAHTRPQSGYAGIRHQSRFAREYVDEFVLLAVLMQKSGLAARKKPREVHSKILQTEQVAKRAFLASRHPGEKGFGIAGRFRPRWCGIRDQSKRRGLVDDGIPRNLEGRPPFHLGTARRSPMKPVTVFAIAACSLAAA